MIIRNLPFIVIALCVDHLLAQTTLTSMLNNLNSQMGQFDQFFKALFYLTGVSLVFSSLMRLKKFGQRTAFMHVEAGIVAPAAQMFIGVALIYSPTLMQTLNQTFWADSGSSCLTCYSTSADSTYEQLIKPMKGVVMLVGMVAFFRGWLILSRAAGQGQTQPGTISKGMTHVIGGFLAININKTYQIMVGTFTGAS
jgi:intracellular multiplication protein IcmC